MTEVTWCPQEVLNYPDVDYRLGFPGFSGGRGANFISNVLEPSLTPDCPGSGAPDVEAAAWFDGNVLNCSRYGDPLCQAAERRLDALVWGQFTHALDESYAQWQSGYLQHKTGCEPAYLYDHMWDYLRKRSVLMVPSAFGL
ncbi:MAG TPA: hypothetical protein QGF58_00685 [Myxococcota bacterium]|nr:hypothetical protein [Myxococcota bacterium]